MRDQTLGLIIFPPRADYTTQHTRAMGSNKSRRARTHVEKYEIRVCLSKRTSMCGNQRHPLVREKEEAIKRRLRAYLAVWNLFRIRTREVVETRNKQQTNTQ